jgi:membrane-associated HD superfamily phosphohydrolase
MRTETESHRTSTPTPIGRALVLGVAAALILGAMLWWDYPAKQFAFALGDVSRVRISAARQITYDSASRTLEAQDKAAAAIADVYDPPDVQIGRQQLARAQSVLNFLDSLRHDPYTNLAQKQDLFGKIPELSLTPAVLSDTLGLEDARWALVSREALASLEQIMRTEIRPEQLADARRVLPRFVSRELTTDETMLASELAKGFVVANSLPNPAQTASLRDEARKAVPPVRVTIRQDETVLREGDVVAPATLEALDALGLLQTQRDWHEVAGQALLAIALAAVIAFYFADQPPRVWVQWRRIALVLSGIAVTLFAAKLMVPAHSLQPYLVPMPALAMTLALIFGAPSAVVITTCLSLVIAQMTGNTIVPELIFYQFIGSVASTASTPLHCRAFSSRWPT